MTTSESPKEQQTKWDMLAGKDQNKTGDKTDKETLKDE